MSPLPPLTVPLLQTQGASGYLCDESGQSHARKNQDSFWLQCGNMSSQEEVGIIRRGGKPQRRGQEGGWGTTCNCTIKSSRCGASLPSLLLVKKKEEALFGLNTTECQMMAHLAPFCTGSSGYLAYDHRAAVSHQSQHPFVV